MVALSVSALILAPDGWHDLEDEINGRELHAESFTTRAYPRRSVDAPGDWMDGTFAVRGSTDNVIENVSVIVSGSTPYEFATRMKTVKGWFDQLNYQMKVRFGDAQETWICPKPGEYTEQLDQPYRFATLGILKVQVARLPAITITQVLL